MKKLIIVVEETKDKTFIVRSSLSSRVPQGNPEAEPTIVKNYNSALLTISQAMTNAFEPEEEKEKEPEKKKEPEPESEKKESKTGAGSVAEAKKDARQGHEGDNKDTEVKKKDTHKKHD